MRVPTNASFVQWPRACAVRPVLGHGPSGPRTDHPNDPCTGYPAGMGVRLFLGHGASGTAASMAPFVDGLVARGVAASAIDLPRRKAEDAVPAFHLVVPAAVDVAIGGHSYGGRVASLAAAR